MERRRFFGGCSASSGGVAGDRGETEVYSSAGLGLLECFFFEPRGIVFEATILMDGGFISTILQHRWCLEDSRVELQVQLPDDSPRRPNLALHRKAAPP